MNVSKNELRKETVTTLKDINRMLEQAGDSTDRRATLLLAKAQCLNTITLLNT